MDRLLSQAQKEYDLGAGLRENRHQPTFAFLVDLGIDAAPTLAQRLESSFYCEAFVIMLALFYIFKGNCPNLPGNPSWDNLIAKNLWLDWLRENGYLP